MEDAKAAWAEVGAKFGGLGEKLKEHFDHPRAPAGGEGAGDGGPSPAGSEAGASAGASTGAAQSTTDAVRDALRNLGDALSGAVEAVGAAAKDPEITNDMRQVGQAFVNALSATFTDVGDDIRRSFSRSQHGSDEPTPGETAPKSATPRSVSPGEGSDDAALEL
jgi:hypothetical protein